jgi:hypothetical protein
MKKLVLFVLIFISVSLAQSQGYMELNQTMYSYYGRITGSNVWNTFLIWGEPKPISLQILPDTTWSTNLDTILVKINASTTYIPITKYPGTSEFRGLYLERVPNIFYIEIKADVSCPIIILAW